MFFKFQNQMTTSSEQMGPISTCHVVPSTHLISSRHVSDFFFTLLKNKSLIRVN